MKLNNVYKMDANKKWYWTGNNYLIGIAKTGCYESDGRKLNWWANKIYEKLDYYKYFKNLIKQLPLIKFSNWDDNHSLIYSIFENTIMQEIKRSIYWFKETGKRSLWISKNEIEEAIQDKYRNKMLNLKYYEEVQKQGSLVYDCFMETAFKELEKIKFRFKEWDWKEKRRILWEEKYLNSKNKSKFQKDLNSDLKTQKTNQQISKIAFSANEKNTKKSNKTLKMKCK